MAWGSLDGFPGLKIQTEDMIKCCEDISTRIRCWVELVPIKG